MRETLSVPDVMICVRACVRGWVGVVWCGVVWCGVVWCGVVWCGVVWCGVVWCGVVWCGVVWCGVVWCGVVWCGVVWCGVSLLAGAKGSPRACRQELRGGQQVLLPVPGILADKSFSRSPCLSCCKEILSSTSCITRKNGVIVYPGRARSRLLASGGSALSGAGGRQGASTCH